MYVAGVCTFIPDFSINNEAQKCDVELININLKL